MSEEPRTAAESSDWKRTTTTAEVWDFLERLPALSHGERLRVESCGRTLLGQKIALVKVSRDGKGLGDASTRSERLRVLIQANIHGGEVEGKEICLQLLREMALGGHEKLLQKIDLWVLPDFNADGNDQISRHNRVSQNGPDDGVGERANSQGLDLNRDYLKAESPEVRAILAVLREFDPHLFLDLHTTNGSAHGYHLTYAPSLAVNQDAAIADYLHGSFLPTVQATLLKEGIRTFDYGNFTRMPDGKQGWRSFGPEPRYASNYAGIRGRLSVLSEAYSYLDFRGRARATKAFVLACMHRAASDAQGIRALCKAADDKMTAKGATLPRLGYDTGFSEAVEREVLVGKLDTQRLEGLGTRRIMTERIEAQKMPVQVRFESHKWVELPEGWALPGASDAVRQRLLFHGLTVERLTQAASVQTEGFEISKAGQARRAFQGHRLRKLAGRFEKKERHLPPGTLIVRARQRLGLLAAQLLCPLSGDGLATWNFFDHELARDDYPVLRLESLKGLETKRLTLQPGDMEVEGSYLPRPWRLRVAVSLEKEGRRLAEGRIGDRARIQQRVLRLQVGDRSVLWEGGKELADLVEGPLGQHRRRSPELMLEPGPGITRRDLDRVAREARKLGFLRVYVDRE